MINCYPLPQVLQSTIYDVDLDRILQSIHVYLQELGMEEIRRRYFFFFSFCGVNKVPVYFSFVEKGGRQLFGAVGCYLNLFALDD